MIVHCSKLKRGLPRVDYEGLDMKLSQKGVPAPVKSG